MSALSDEDDDALVRRCLLGQESAWTALVGRYQRLVYAIVRRAGLDEHTAADVFQTVFSRLLTHLKRIDDPTRLRAWIVTSAKREALLQRSRARRTVSLTPSDDDEQTSLPEPVDDSPLPEQWLEELQQADLLRRALERIDERCRALLLLLFAEVDVPPAYEEVARRVGMPVGSIGPTRARCLSKLRQLVA